MRLQYEKNAIFELYDENMTRGPKNLFELHEFSKYVSSN